MKPPILFRSLAKSEYELAAVWYDEARVGLGIEFETAVEAVLNEAAGSPERFPIADGDVREAPVPGFPYCIYYRFRRNTLIVVAVYHQSRDPSGWQGRI